MGLIYVVLGMHKSGTTLVSQMLHHSGISMGGSLDLNVSYDKGNQYEDDTPYRLNLEFIEAPDDLVLFLETPRDMKASEEQRERMKRYIEDRRRECDHWGFKDPRTCLTYPLWEKELPEHRLIVVYRTAEEGWPRFRPQGIREKRRIFSYASNFLARWCEHNDNIIQCLAATPMKSIVLSYRDLMNGDSEFDRLQEFVGRPVEDRRRKDLYRSPSKKYWVLEQVKKSVRKKTNYDTDGIFEKLEQLRESAVAGG